MDLKQLEYFVVACEQGSLSQAAKSMYTSQPNVSKNIHALERELGRPLLERTGKGVVPTTYGKTVLEHARLILKTASAITSLAIPEVGKGIGLSSYPSNMITRLLVDFYRTYGTDCTIEHREGSVEEIVEQVRQGISELGILFVAQRQTASFQRILTQKGLEFIALASRNICLYVGPEHPLYRADSVHFSDLARLKFVRGVRDLYSMENHLDRVSMGVIDTSHLNHVVYTNSDHLTVNLLLHTDVCSLGLDFVYSPYRQYDIRALPIKGCEPFLQVGYVRGEGRPLSAQAQWVITHFEAML